MASSGLTTEGRKMQRQGWLAALLLAMRLIDVGVIGGAGILAFWLRNGFVHVPRLEMVAITFASMLSVVVFNLGQAYMTSTADKFWLMSGRVLGHWALVFLLLIATAFLLHEAGTYSRRWAALWFFLASAGFAGARLSGTALIRSVRLKGNLVTRVAIIGADPGGLELFHHLRNRGRDVEVVGVYDDRMDRLKENAKKQGVTILGTVAHFLAWARYARVDCVVIALPWTSEHRLREMIEALQSLDIEIQICPEGLGFVVQSFPLLRQSVATTLGGLPMFSVSRRPLDGWNWLIKDIEDRLLITLLLPLVLPVCLLVALAIKLDSPGPVLFKQQRSGFNGRNFWVYKFRTMRAADSVPTGVTVATQRVDPRVTKVGNILRRTSLDELPQLINVLRGEMSIIGPRPHAVDHDQQFARVIRQYYARHRVRPGITGWAQVNGLRGTIEAEEQIRQRVAMDLWYIENWSILFDLRILLMTPFVGLVNRNAY
jgi:putative colanic acid biosynthesis UDP-glucose lipid carrier transferase